MNSIFCATNNKTKTHGGYLLYEKRARPNEGRRIKNKTNRRYTKNCSECGFFGVAVLVPINEMRNKHQIQRWLPTCLLDLADALDICYHTHIAKERAHSRFTVWMGYTIRRLLDSIGFPLCFFYCEPTIPIFHLNRLQTFFRNFREFCSFKTYHLEWQIRRNEMKEKRKECTSASGECVRVCIDFKNRWNRRWRSGLDISFHVGKVAALHHKKSCLDQNSDINKLNT